MISPRTSVHWKTEKGLFVDVASNLGCGILSYVSP